MQKQFEWQLPFYVNKKKLSQHNGILCSDCDVLLLESGPGHAIYFGSWVLSRYDTKKRIFERYLRLDFIVLVFQKLTCEHIRTIILENKKQIEER